LHHLKGICVNFHGGVPMSFGSSRAVPASDSQIFQDHYSLTIDDLKQHQDLQHNPSRFLKAAMVDVTAFSLAGLSQAGAIYFGTQHPILGSAALAVSGISFVLGTAISTHVVKRKPDHVSDVFKLLFGAVLMSVPFLPALIPFVATKFLLKGESFLSDFLELQR